MKIICLVNIALNIITICLCIIGIIRGWKVDSWVLLLWVILAIHRSICDYQKEIDLDNK